MTQLQVWEKVRHQLWEDAERQTPKPPYAAYLEDRSNQLRRRALVIEPATK
jgi:hypothetical protein